MRTVLKRILKTSERCWSRRKYSESVQVTNAELKDLLAVSNLEVIEIVSLILKTDDMFRISARVIDDG